VNIADSAYSCAWLLQIIVKAITVTLHKNDCGSHILFVNILEIIIWFKIKTDDFIKYVFGWLM